MEQGYIDSTDAASGDINGSATALRSLNYVGTTPISTYATYTSRTTTVHATALESCGNYLLHLGSNGGMMLCHAPHEHAAGLAYTDQAMQLEPRILHRRQQCAYLISESQDAV